MAEPYLTFTVNETLYAVSVFRVQEVLDYSAPQKLPCTDPVIAGLITSRGHSVSVIDTRLKFGFEPKTADAETRYVVLEVHDDEQGTVTPIAITADSVLEVLELEPSEQESVPELGASIAKRFIKGIARKDNRFIIILDTDRIFSAGELSAPVQEKPDAVIDSVQVSGILQTTDKPAKKTAPKRRKS